MIKKILALFLILVIFSAAGITYLNKVFLPTKIKSLVVDAIKTKTGKDVSLGGIKFSIFKGLVLRDLKVYDNKKALLEIKEAACNFLIFPVFRKQLVIPGAVVKDAYIFINRRSDGTFNIADLVSAKDSSKSRAGFNILLRKIRVINTSVRFEDHAVSPVFSKDIQIKNAVIYITLPVNAKFQLVITQPFSVKAGGSYNILRKSFSGRVDVVNAPLEDFAAYYSFPAVKLSAGSADLTANINLQDKILAADIAGNINSLGITAGKAKTKLTFALSAKLSYDTSSGLLAHSARLNITQPAELLLADIGRISNIKVNLILENGVSGSPGETVRADIINADAHIDKVKLPITGISGSMKFVPDRLTWSNLSFVCQDTAYKTDGALSSFTSPSADLRVSSQDLYLDLRFNLKDKILNVSKLYAHYLNSVAASKAVINIDNPEDLYARIGANIRLNLADLKKILKNNAKQLEAVNPRGLANINLRMVGRLGDIKTWLVDAGVTSPDISLYGLKAQNVFFEYKQSEGLAGVPLLHLSLYGGAIDGALKADVLAQDLPYWLEASMHGVNLQELKLDTAAKKENISGIMQGEIKLNGFGFDAARLSGAGNVLLTEGRLWELNLFQGFGKLIFVKDFANITFKEAGADFIIKDKYVTSDNILLKSDLANLSGTCKIGFDSSIDAIVDVQVLNETAPTTGGFKDIATAIVGEAGRFGTIKITGTLKEPKYKFKADVVNILDSIKNTILKNIQG